MFSKYNIPATGLLLQVMHHENWPVLQKFKMLALVLETIHYRTLMRKIYLCNYINEIAKADKILAPVLTNLNFSLPLPTNRRRRKKEKLSVSCRQSHRIAITIDSKDFIFNQLLLCA